MFKFLLKTLLLIAVVFVTLLILIMFFHNKFIYFPQKLSDSWKQPAWAEEVWFTSGDGIKLHGVYSKPANANRAILWCHGNAGNIAYRLDMMAGFINQDIGVLLFDYRGYGKSSGSPTEEGTYLDAIAAYEFLTEQKKINPLDIVIFGKSLGGGVATELATKVKCHSLILQSTFTDIKDMASRIIPIIPAYLLISTNYDNLSKIKRIQIPKLFIHSPADEIVPFELGKKLFEAGPNPKEFYVIQNAKHNETYLTAKETYFKRIRDFINREN